MLASPSSPLEALSGDAGTEPADVSPGRLPVRLRVAVARTHCMAGQWSARPSVGTWLLPPAWRPRDVAPAAPHRWLALLDAGSVGSAARVSPRPWPPSAGRRCALGAACRLCDLGAVCWNAVVDSEINIVVQVLSLLCWPSMCFMRGTNSVALQAHELMTSQVVPYAELSWVRVPESRQRGCLRFLAEHCRNAQSLAIREPAHFNERLLLRLVCSMRCLESLEVDASPFGGAFPEPQRLLDRLAKYCPRLQHLELSFRHEAPAGLHVLAVRSLASLGRRLLTLDLGSVSVEVPGGTKTIAACCPQLQRLCAQLSQRQSNHEDAVDPADLSRGCPHLVDLDLSPIDWSDTMLEQFMASSMQLQSLAMHRVALYATVLFLAPLASSALVCLHLALHARTDTERALRWLEDVARLESLRSLSLDYAAPLLLADITGAALEALGGARRDDSRGLTALVIHGCHGVTDASLSALAARCPRLEKLRILPDTWRNLGEVTDTGLLSLTRGLPRLRVFATSSQLPVLSDSYEGCAPSLRMLSCYAPLDDRACAVVSAAWKSLRFLWLGPQKVMQAGVGVGSSISDAGLTLVAQSCPLLLDLTVASLCVSNEGAEFTLKNCHELRRVRLGGRGVTDAVLDVLRGLRQPRLERFALWYSGVSADGARVAQEAMPWTHFDIEVLDPL